MKLSLLALFFVAVLAVDPAYRVTRLVDQIKADVLTTLDQRERDLRRRGKTPRCTPRNVAFRRE